MVVQHFLVAFAVTLEQRFQGSGAFLPVFDIELDVLAFFGQPAHQQIDILCLGAGQDHRVQIRDLVIV